jgi:hypothetical protein
MFRKVFAVCLLSGLMALVILPALAQTSTSTPASTPASLVGIWQLTLTPSTSSVPGDTVLANFTPDGGVIVGAASSGTSASNPALGQWSASASATPTAAVNQVSMSFTSDITNSGGSVAGTNSFKVTVRVSSSGTLTGNYQLVVTDGTASTTTGGTITGTLMSHFMPPA